MVSVLCRCCCFAFPGLRDVQAQAYPEEFEAAQRLPCCAQTVSPKCNADDAVKICEDQLQIIDLRE